MVVKIKVPLLATLNNRCRIIIGTQKRDHNFDNHPYRVQGLGVQSCCLGFRALVFRVGGLPRFHALSIGSKVVPFWGFIVRILYKVIPKRTTMEPMGIGLIRI